MHFNRLNWNKVTNVNEIYWHMLNYLKLDIAGSSHNNSVYWRQLCTRWGFAKCIRNKTQYRTTYSRLCLSDWINAIFHHCFRLYIRQSSVHLTCALEFTTNRLSTQATDCPLQGLALRNMVKLFIQIIYPTLLQVAKFGKLSTFSFGVLLNIV